MSFTSSSPARAASIPRPVHPSLKRKRSQTPIPSSSASNRARDLDGVLLKSRKIAEVEVVEHSLSGWVALKFIPRAIESPEDEIADSENDYDEELSESSSSVTSKHSHRERSADIAESSATATPVGTPVLQNAVLPFKRRQLEDIWDIDGLDINAVMTKGAITKFTKKQEMKILLWMKVNGARGITGHTNSFNMLLAELGFAEQGHEKNVEDVLRLKVNQRMKSNYTALKAKGIVEDAKTHSGTAKDNLSIKFAAYTEIWLRKDWDGVVECPISYFAETIELDHEVDSDAYLLDNTPEVFVVEEPMVPKPPPPAPKRRTSKTKGTRVTQVPVEVAVEIPEIDVMKGIHDAWTAGFAEMATLVNPNDPQDLLTKSAIYASEWNVAAVQAQYAGVDMPKKIILDEALDGLLESSGEDEAESENGMAGLGGFHTNRSQSSRQDPATVYAMVDPLHISSPESTPEPRILTQVKSPANRLRLLLKNFGDTGTQRANSSDNLDDELSDGEASSDHESNDEDAHAERDEDVEEIAAEDEMSGQEEDFADEEDNGEENNYFEPPLTGTTVSFLSTDFEIPISPRVAIASQQAALQGSGMGIGTPYEIIPLTCETYKAWKSQIHALLLAQGVWGVISGDDQSPIPYSLADDEEFDKAWAEHQRESREWRRKTGVCVGWMLLTMGAEVRDAINAQGVEDPIKLWSMLRDEFEVLG
ncbi:uncharacterized protein LY89DRAFT_714387 [Mollisia scopiformis]|uniref:Uncharacterized protein n=1 Tax=Mollisia scopiformis TaxID=149040 RepID=A0A194XR58_MOLSC|nr:uncharacterized protein LY89DRAFT_714387 [Mollisia scopiformis]KUJ22636.1 hypothetical protein LY89DRAFT_714387 [Mollisia scopiformis]